MERIAFRQVTTEEDSKQAKLLIREYLDWLNDRVRSEYDIEFDVEAMVASDLADASKFHPPTGRFYLAFWNGQVAGVGCLKQLEQGVGEIQRMYVPTASRGQGIGRAMAHRLIADAREIGYGVLRLESLEFLHAAHALYRSLGFRETEPYAGNSMDSYQDPEQLARYHSITVFMELVFDREESAA
jgi:putative acetyltransferase